ncbi:MAG TPA: VanZ family protein [Blastocatellia bacterium]|nr:VanZ family protein [Blastocatellia bacterium]
MTTVRGTVAARIARYWGPVLMMIAAMYVFSTDFFSFESTRAIVAAVLGWFMTDVSSTAIAEGNYVLRKSAHFAEYAVLAALVFRAFRADSMLRWRLIWGLYSLGVVVCWAVMDEYHQSQMRRRGGSVYDSLLDSAGGLFALVVIALWSRRRSRSGAP